MPDPRIGAEPTELVLIGDNVFAACNEVATCFHVDLRVLLRNLRDAGAACEAFVLGGKHADDLWFVGAHDSLWRPGCQRPAHGRDGEG